MLGKLAEYPHVLPYIRKNMETRPHQVMKSSSLHSEITE